VKVLHLVPSRFLALALGLPSLSEPLSPKSTKHKTFSNTKKLSLSQSLDENLQSFLEILVLVAIV